MSIPKVVIQTWNTSDLPEKIKHITTYMQIMNPSYEFKLYTDADILLFLTTFSDDIDDNELLLETYNSIIIGAAKADFFRYLVLYKYGGIYLDMDAIIIQPIEELFKKIEINNNTTRENIHAIITRETNYGIFNNWIFCFAPKHPFMYMMIHYCVFNIQNQTTFDILTLTGPIAFTKIINILYLNFLEQKSEFILKNNMIITEEKLAKIVKTETFFEKSNMLYDLSDDEFAKQFSFCNTYIYDKDMGEFARCKNRFSDLLYKDNPHWRKQLENNGGSPFSISTKDIEKK